MYTHIVLSYHYINITAAWAVDREFCYILWGAWAPFGSLWGALGLPWGALGLLWDLFGLPLGCPWTPLGCPWTAWGLHGVPWGSLAVPWGTLGGPLGMPWGALGCLGRFSQICRKLDAQFRANVSICTRLRIESSLPELAYGARGARGNGVTERCSDPPWSRAPGARIT